MSQNKSIVEKSQQILEEYGYKVKTNHLYNLFSKLSGHASWNVGKVKNVEFKEVLKDLELNSSPETEVLPQTILVTPAEKQTYINLLNSELQLSFKKEVFFEIGEKEFQKIQNLNAVAEFRTWLADLETKGYELVPVLDQSKLLINWKIEESMSSSFKDFMKDNLVKKLSKTEAKQLYLKKLKAGAFKHRVVYGIKESNNELMTVIAEQEPGAFFCGGFGSGKTLSAVFTAATHLFSNGTTSLYFYCDMVRGASDYSVLTQDGNGKERTNAMRVLGKESVKELINLTYQEYKQRKALLTEVDAKSLRAYNQVKAVPLAEMHIFIEEFHHFVPEFKGTETLTNLYTLLRDGRSHGIFFNFATPSIREEFFPGSLIPGMTNNFVFKLNNSSDLGYFNFPHSQEITDLQRGRAVTNNNEFVQFIYLSEEDILELSKEYVIQFKARLLSINIDTLTSTFKRFNSN